MPYPRIHHWQPSLWLKAILPSSCDGLNLRSALRHAPAAYLALHTTFLPLVERILGHPPGPSHHINSVVSALSSTAGRLEWQSLENTDVPICQNHLLMRHPIISCPQPPTAVNFPVLSVAHGTADIYGDHQVGCGGNGDRIFCYNSIQNVVFAVAQSAALASSREASGMVLISLSHPADVFLPSWSCGRPAALEIHVLSPLQQLTLVEASVSLGHALQIASKSSCLSGVECIPIVTEILGGLTEGLDPNGEW